MRITKPGKYVTTGNNEAVVKFRMPDEYQGMYPWVGYTVDRDGKFIVMAWSDNGETESIDFIVGPWSQEKVTYAALYASHDVADKLIVTKFMDTIDQIRRYMGDVADKWIYLKRTERGNAWESETILELFDDEDDL